MAVDAFTLDWSRFRAFCFPPFSLISRVLQTLELCQAECVIVVPFWTTQVWFTKLLKGKSSQKISGPKYVSCGVKNRFLCL